MNKYINERMKGRIIDKIKKIKMNHWINPRMKDKRINERMKGWMKYNWESWAAKEWKNE